VKTRKTKNEDQGGVAVAECAPDFRPLPTPDTSTATAEPTIAVPPPANGAEIERKWDGTPLMIDDVATTQWYDLAEADKLFGINPQEITDAARSGVYFCDRRGTPGASDFFFTGAALVNWVQSNNIAHVVTAKAAQIWRSKNPAPPPPAPKPPAADTRVVTSANIFAEPYISRTMVPAWLGVPLATIDAAIAANQLPDPKNRPIDGSKIPDDAIPCARLAQWLASSMTPYRITDEGINAWKARHPQVEDVVAKIDDPLDAAIAAQKAEADAKEYNRTLRRRECLVALIAIEVAKATGAPTPTPTMGFDEIAATLGPDEITSLRTDVRNGVEWQRTADNLARITAEWQKAERAVRATVERHKRELMEAHDEARRWDKTRGTCHGAIESVMRLRMARADIFDPITGRMLGVPAPEPETVKA